MSSRLPFTSPFLLAPMEGVTDRLFRSLVLARNPSSALGGATTEFVRVTDAGLGLRHLERELAGESHGRPVGLQLMGADLGAVEASAAAAAEAGAPFIDLNFGCPAKGALRGAAGSALLDDPAALGALVAATARALEGSGVPLTAKLRAGGDDDSRLEELVARATDGGAAMITIHCRTRAEGYRDTADWQRLARAVSATHVPICGNGGITRHADLERMRTETGCAFVMVGRAALADPWIFSGARVSRSEALAFLREYASQLSPPKGKSSRLKQLVAYWQAADLLADERSRILRLDTDAEVLAAIERLSRRTPI
jgi:tRNA-dihydrouridine synthase C